jgi:hypothetical protein
MNSKEWLQRPIKLTEKAGTNISKEKLLEAIRKSPNKQFNYSKSSRANTKTVVMPN